MQGEVGFREALGDPKLFGLDLHSRQRDLAEVVERTPLTVAACGRRSGKSLTGAALLVWDACLRRSLADYLRRGERRFCVGVATSLRQSRLLIAAARTLVENSPLLRELLEAATDDELHFTTGSSVVAFPCTARGGRGWPVSSLVLDEFAHHLDTDGNSAAEQVWRAFTPSVAQFGDHARILVASTPFGSSGLFAELHARAAAGELEDAAAFHATTADMNPRVARAFLDRERVRLGEEANRSEYEAAFVGCGASFLDGERIDAAVSERGELAPEQATGWILGVDFAFSSDPTGIAVVGRDRDRPDRLVLGVAASRRPPRQRPGSWEERRALEDAVVAEVAGLALRYRANVAMDSFAAAPAVLDRLRRAGLSVQTHPLTAQSKTLAFQEVRARLNAGTIDLYPEETLIAELRRLRSKYAAGSASVVTPRAGGTHCDVAVALALAVLQHGQGGAFSGEGAQVLRRRDGDHRRRWSDAGWTNQLRHGPLIHASVIVSGPESERNGGRGRNGPRAVGAKRGPPARRVITADDVDWTALSPEAREALRTVGMRVAVGRTYEQIAEETGMTPDAVKKSLTELRAEIRAQLEG